MSNLKIFTGTNSQQLGEKIVNVLGVTIGACELKHFSDGEIWMRYNENIRGRDVFIIQSTNPPSDNLMEMLISDGPLQVLMAALGL